MRRRARLERPSHLMAMVDTFFREALKLKVNLLERIRPAFCS